MAQHTTHKASEAEIETAPASSMRSRLHALMFGRAGVDTALPEPGVRGGPKIPPFQGE